MAQSFKTTISAFLGLRESEIGEGQLKKGESPKMKNLAITPDYTLVKRDGWKRVVDLQGEGRGLFAGDINGVYSVLWVVDENVYLLSDGQAVNIGSLETNSGEVTLFKFGTELYFLDGKKIKVWNGEALSDISPYVPTIAISCDASGAGIAFEDVNLVSDRRIQFFTPDGTSSIYKLAEENITSVVGAWVNGKFQTKSQYTVDIEKGTINFHNTPEYVSPNGIKVTYSKESEEMNSIHRMKYATAYGSDNDTRVFLWGDEQEPSVIRYSGVYNGTSSFAYFPSLNFNKVVSGDAITSVVRFYDNLMIFAENETFSCYGEKTQDLQGVEYMIYPIKTVSLEQGCAVYDFAKLIDNTPVTLSHSGLYRWSSSSLRDERNAKEIGSRIRAGLKAFGVEGVRSFDRFTASELFIWKGDKIYVYNYALDVFYYYEGFDAVNFCLDNNGETWFIRKDGALCKMDSSKLDDGKPVSFVWESGYEESFGLTVKNVHRLEFELFPLSDTDFNFVWVSERATGRHESLRLEYRVADFENLCFDLLSFDTMITPIRLFKRIKAKRVRGFKIIIKNGAENGDFNLHSVSIVGDKTDLQ